ncbi:integration host factor subunit beta [Acidithiobacillus sp. MC6.1]|nr:integration host factor subunit beta [Acidithiobacillus sp. MC6.1]
MVKSELIHKIAESNRQLGLSELQVRQAVDRILDTMTGALSAGQRIEIRDFGSFSIHTSVPKKGRNPKTGEYVWVPARRQPHFKPGKVMRESVVRKQEYSGLCQSPDSN